MNWKLQLAGYAATALLLGACASAPTAPPAPVEPDMAAEMHDDMTKPMTSTVGDGMADVTMPMTDTMDTKTPVDMMQSMTGTMDAETHDDMTEPMTDTMGAATHDMAMERPAWQSISLTDAVSGTSFTVADFAGKVVYIEPFATWCTTCRQQLTNVKAAKAMFGDDVVFVALSVEPNIGADALASYANEQGFDWLFAAMPPAMLQALAAEYGQTIANPPAAPHLIVRADGSTTDLATGIHDAATLAEKIKAAQM